jgi:hypothetical protein
MRRSVVVSTIGITQTLAWGSTYYLAAGPFLLALHFKTSATAGLGRKQLRTLRRERPLGPHTTGRAPYGGHAPRCSGHSAPSAPPAGKSRLYIGDTL